ncbi:MAG: hypothetical protein M1839_005286 [Geoglossum umbratile]|nr:MAG: hypothetical protein M1839_005286 [Geoglossum umbratile]
MSDSSRLTLNCFCGRTYGNAIDLEEHRRARGHFSSHRCGPLCNHPQVSPGPVRMQSCNSCGKKCERDDILRDHRTFTGHCFCSECDRVFESQGALKEHLRTELHASEFRCCNCNIDFKDVHALNAHMASRAHRRPLPADRENPKPQVTALIDGVLPCEDCDRTFKSASALRAHRASVKHKPLSNLTCPLGKKCTMRFTSPSALIQHLESGKCDSGTTRDKIYGLIQSHDPEKLIHSPPEDPPLTPQSYLPSETSPTNYTPRRPNLLADSDNWSLVPSPSIFSLDESAAESSLVSGPRTPTSDGRHSVYAPISHRLRCPLCPETHRRFAVLQDLERHMASPVHCPKVYHCPVGLFPEGRSSQAPRFFSTLGGLAQHLESGACQGGEGTFKKIVEFIERRLNLLGFRSMPLLLAGYRGKKL